MENKSSYGEKVQQEFIKLNEHLAGIYKSKSDFMNWLMFQLNFHQLSPLNRNMIYLHNPKATYVASYHKWKELGFLPSGKGTGLPIFCPVIHRYFIDDNGKSVPLKKATSQQRDLIQKKVLKELHYTTWRIGYVFDISSTKATEKDLMGMLEKDDDKYVEDALDRLENWYCMKRDYQKSETENVYEIIKEKIVVPMVGQWDIPEELFAFFIDVQMFLAMSKLHFETETMEYKTLQQMDSINWDEIEKERIIKLLKNDILECGDAVYDVVDSIL